MILPEDIKDFMNYMRNDFENYLVNTTACVNNLKNKLRKHITFMFKTKNAILYVYW